ncbi:MAG: tRNA pseudouridine(55) synthase TruB [Balneolaceae bacterium]|nr:tRNA pseudouridine(55) synthase TruB [Balneolaceae bacterium]
MAKAVSLDQLPVFSQNEPPPPDYDYTKGALMLVDKPSGWTSFDVVNYLKKSLNAGKVGHAGTLDPMATGLLVICCGKATKTVSQIQSMPKEYEGVVTFGASTPSRDAETEIEETAPFEHITREKIDEVLENHFSGEVEQVPPMYSAVKHKGKRLYKLARQGKEVKRKPRIVEIYETRILEFEPPKLTLYVKCGKGTYIRSIAYDLGKKLDSLAYLSALTRTAIGPYSNGDALTIDDLREIKFE